MTKQPKLRLGTRQSPLAVAQAEEARERLCQAHGWDEADIELVKVRASGDKIQDRPLADIGGKALWTRELDIWLAEGKIDAAVHSMKDVETIRPDSLTIAAILPREDVRDVLIGARSIREIPQGARIGTSAPRRAAQMLHQRPDCSIVSFRGNVATRLAKLSAGEADVTLLAAAGLNRTNRQGTGTALDPAEWLPAPAQGAIGIECNTADAQTRAFLAAIDDAPSRHSVMAERAMLGALGGTCHSPIAVMTTRDGEMLALRAAIFSADGYERAEGTIRMAPGDMAAAAGLGRDLLSRAPISITKLFEGG
ncbi:hydroxymethylbilane synthase [Pontixanthobacter gangjinensis]|uniref:Porphobilinogen deaminase n=1 Tax=Pontixanthobacter gangjinensis TaxID=1028742 RepID=A0A6I4SPA7_9SPHN|nr:hydroxymethylbilane synthase [Pontixanthobacter gangjinensis]MXO57613.1 hydroxymethylbilane synthase [Pontixanthobacter gangjinensis]